MSKEHGIISPRLGATGVHVTFLSHFHSHFILCLCGFVRVFVCADVCGVCARVCAGAWLTMWCEQLGFNLPTRVSEEVIYSRDSNAH